jgi:hypothetical protein
MSGQRHIVDKRGELYEDAVKLMMSPVATMVKVQPQADFGVDFYCEPRFLVEDNIETVDGLCAIQVKGGAAALKFGGLDRKNNWRKQDFKWLMSLATPLYLAKVTAAIGARLLDPVM